MDSEYSLPKISLDNLEQKIDHSIALQFSKLPEPKSLSIEAETDTSGINDLIKHIKGLSENAQLRGAERTTWPDSLNKFPFVLLKPFKKIILKFINILFKDQIEVNQNLAEGLQQSLLINQELMREIINLRYHAYRDLENLHHYQQLSAQQITETILPNSLREITDNLYELNETIGGNQS